MDAPHRRARFAPLAVTAAALATALTLAGCSATTGTTTPVDPSGGAAPSAAPTAAQSGAPEPAGGSTITGTGYEYSVPEGWGDPGEVSGFSPDSIAADLTDDDGFADNVNVILSPAGLVTPEQVESAGVGELQSAGATDVTVDPRVEVGGSESAHLSATFSSGGASYLIEQYYVSDAAQTYVVTFSFSPTVSTADRAAVTDPVLASWTFTG